MDKYLVIVIGKQLITPMFIHGGDKVLEILSQESRLNEHLLYVMYQYDYKADIYRPYKTLVGGKYQEFCGYHIRGLVFNA